MIRALLLAAPMLIAAVVAAQAQKAVPTKPLLDNERVRVSEMRLGPGGKIELPNFPDQLAYLLTDASLVFSTPGKTPYQLDFRAGEATLLPASSTAAENESGEEVRALLIQIKQGGSSKGARQAKGKPAKAAKQLRRGKKSASNNTDQGDS